MDGYIRVSQVAGRTGDRFQSPTAQRDAIAGWARAHGVRVAAWHEDLDQSGGTMDRPGMNEALRRIEAGATSGVIVARLDRFARTVVGGLTTIRDLHERGAAVVSVAESLDPTSPIGRAMLGLLLIMAEWQRDQADEHLAAAQQRATSAGRFPGRPSFGYARTSDGLTVVDEQEAQVVRRIFRARAGGAGWRRIADELTRGGVVTPNGRDRWSATTVQGIVKSEAPLGVFIGPRELRVENAWPAIVERDVWEAANARRGVRDDSRRYQDRLFAGIARCAACRNVLARAVNPHGFVSYACNTVGCTQRGSMGAALLDAHVAALVDERLARVALEPQPADGGQETARLTAAREAAVRELEAWRDDVELRGVLGDRDWREGMTARARARDAAEVELAEHRARGGLAIEDLPEGVVPRLEDLPWEVRRQVVEALLHSVWMRRGTVRGPNARRHVGDRLLVVWRDDRDPPALPTRTGPTAQPVRWPAAAPTQTAGPRHGGAPR
jgi:DNA invertase Pin-like site-specific DNA recombinase